MDITSNSITTYLASVGESRKADILWLINQLETITQRKPKMWGTIIGFGRLHYRYQTGHEGEMPMIGLANRKQAITLYLSFDFESYPERKNLGKHTAGKSCLYIKSLNDINRKTLIEIMQIAFRKMQTYPFVKVVE